MTRHTTLVLQHVRDLLAEHGRQRVDLDAAVPGLPLGVAARLALISAGTRSPEVLAPRADDRTVRPRKLLLDGLLASPSTSLTGDLDLPVRCGKALHHLRLKAGGGLELLDHPSMDVASERVAVALGGEPVACLRELMVAGRTHAPPVADDGPRVVAIGAGELLAFAATVRGWLARGWTVSGAAAALEAGTGYDDVAAHLQAGFDLTDAVAWSRVTPARAKRWKALGFGVVDAELWEGQGRTLEQAERAAVAVPDTRWLARWARQVGARMPCDVLVEWASFGAPIGVWGEVADRGMRATEVPAWLEAGFTPVEVLRHGHLLTPLDVALAWRDEGFTAYVATAYLGVGMTLDDAVSLRGLPTAKVVEAWNRHRSVPGVLRALGVFVR